MYKVLLIFFICLHTGMAVFAQTETDSIKVLRSNGQKYFYKGQKISYFDMKRIMRDHPDALDNVQKANSRAVVGNVMVFAGSFMIGWTIGTSIAGGDPSLPLTLAGAGIMALSVPILRSSNKKAIQAINQYHSELPVPRPTKQKPVILGFSPNGVSLQYQF